ncbi:MAG: hypothetical protein V6017_00205 [Candidatus Dasytiphilus stammeri]
MDLFVTYILELICFIFLFFVKTSLAFGFMNFLHNSTFVEEGKNITQSNNNIFIINPINKNIIKLDLDYMIINLQPLLIELIDFINLNLKNNNILLINRIQNNTNHYFSIKKINMILNNILINNLKIKIINQLKIKNMDNNFDINKNFFYFQKNIETARHLNAQFMLITSINGNILDCPVIHMQLLIVNSGEIIWSRSSRNYISIE